MSENEQTSPQLESFLEATKKISDEQYEYTIRSIGESALLQDLDEQQIERETLESLSGAELHAYFEDEDERYQKGEWAPIPKSLHTAVEHLKLVSDKVGTINGYSLTNIDDSIVSLSATDPTDTDTVGIISLTAHLGQRGDIVTTKRRVLAREDLEVTPEDIATIDLFIQKIIALDPILPE